MRKRISLIALSALVTVSIVTFNTSAMAADGWYMSGDFGISIFDPKKTGFEQYARDNLPNIYPMVDGKINGSKNRYFSGSVGYSWNNFRIEGELSYRKTRFNNENLKCSV